MISERYDDSVWIPVPVDDTIDRRVRFFVDLRDCKIDCRAGAPGQNWCAPGFVASQSYSF